MATNDIVSVLQEVSRLADILVQGTLADPDSRYQTVLASDLNNLHRALADLKDIQEIGEPFFVLLGRDPQAPDLVDLWASVRSRMGGAISLDGMIEAQKKASSARDIVAAMIEFKKTHPTMGFPQEAFDRVKAELTKKE